MDNDNEQEAGKVLPFRPAVVDSTVPAPAEQTEFDYVIHTTDGEAYYETGFTIFTNAHVIIMTESASGSAIPLLLVPLANVKLLAMVEDLDEV